MSKIYRPLPLAVLDELTGVFSFIAETTRLWATAGKFAFQLCRKGVTNGLSDCFIAVAAASVHAPVATLDSHFQLLAKPAKIALYPLL